MAEGCWQPPEADGDRSRFSPRTCGGSQVPPTLCFSPDTDFRLMASRTMGKYISVAGHQVWSNLLQQL